MNRGGTPSTQLVPLVKPVDAVVPDPPYRRQFASQVDALLNDAPKFAAGSNELNKAFTTWRDMVPGFAALAANAPVLDTASSRVLQLQKLGSAGLEALQYLQSGKSAPSDWKDAQLALIKLAETPDSSFLKLPWLNSYRVLILAAADVGSLKDTDRQQWKQKIQNEAAKNAPKEKYTW